MRFVALRGLAAGAKPLHPGGNSIVKIDLKRTEI